MHLNNRAAQLWDGDAGLRIGVEDPGEEVCCLLRDGKHGGEESRPIHEVLRVTCVVRG